jgi:cyclophilin family peptidyl-prolyl cis-trans isomerase
MGTPERTGAAPPLELAPTPFTRGSVGWASSGPDGDDDLFVTTDDLPELTGRHTRLGTVVSGLASLERLGPDRHVLRASFVVDPGDESAL